MNEGYTKVFVSLDGTEPVSYTHLLKALAQDQLSMTAQ